MFQLNKLQNNIMSKVTVKELQNYYNVESNNY